MRQGERSDIARLRAENARLRSEAVTAGYDRNRLAELETEIAEAALRRAAADFAGAGAAAGMALVVYVFATVLMLVWSWQLTVLVYDACGAGTHASLATRRRHRVGGLPLQVANAFLRDGPPQRRHVGVGRDERLPA